MHDPRFPPARSRSSRFHGAVLVATILMLTACSTLGPSTIERDRSDYATVIATTWKEQTLLNIVKLRYADAPVYLEVSSVISSTAIQSQVNLSASWFNGSPAEGNNQTLGASGLYTDRPTISYTPLSGERFSRYLLTPLSPAAIFSLVQAGYPVDRVLHLTTRAANGLYNRSTSPSRLRAADPEFYAVLDALRRIQRSEKLGMRISQRAGTDSELLLIADTRSEIVETDRRLVRQSLHLRPDAEILKLTFGSVQRDDTEVALLTRSMSEIFSEIAATIEAPPIHVQEGRANPEPALPKVSNEWDTPLVRIHSSERKPDNAYAAVHYRDHWFWIDDRDLKSKSEFLFILVLLSLAETGVAPETPVITIPAN